MQLFHDKTHIKKAGKIENMIVTNRDTGLRPGDSRHPVKCNNCYRVVGTVQRKHTSVEQGKARAPGDQKTSVLEKNGRLTMATPPFVANGGATTTSFFSYARKRHTSSSIISRTIAPARMSLRSNTSIISCACANVTV